MPTYTYKCKDCDTSYEKVRGISDSEPEYSCTVCNSYLTKVYLNIGVTFQGSGFYSTDK